MNPSNKQSKNIILSVILVIIVGTIWYIESNKPTTSTAPAQDIDISSISASTTVSSASSSVAASRIKIDESGNKPAKELADIQGYINSPAIIDGVASTTAPFKLADYVGKKVILLDFWTYSCINCLRTLPYLTAWDQKYKDQGLLIVGVHTPEFDFEKDYGNVAAAVQRLGIHYPVVLDSDYGTWNAYGNMYWPHEYLIDIDGYVVHDHIGEGGYAETEEAIQTALNQRDQVLGIASSSIAVGSDLTTPSNAVAMDPSQVQSPETYFGSARNEYLGNGTQDAAGPQTLTLPDSPTLNTLYLGGAWNFQDQFAENTSQTADIVFNYNAKNVYFVAAADIAVAAQGVKIKVLIDGQPISSDQAGADVASDGTVTITGNRLYSLVNGTAYGQHTLHLEVEGPGLDAFTFTFG